MTLQVVPTVLDEYDYPPTLLTATCTCGEGFLEAEAHACYNTPSLDDSPNYCHCCHTCWQRCKLRANDRRIEKERERNRRNAK